MTIHKEGFGTITVVTLALAIVNTAVYLLSSCVCALTISLILSAPIFFLVVNFFRSPNRQRVIEDNAVISCADGKVVVIEEVYEAEYLKTNCIQVSVFMSPMNVHVNWYPIKGVVEYYRHHAGRFMAAYLPKSSTENERSTVVIRTENGQKLLFRQVAGALARRIVTYSKENDVVGQGDEYGFIKFGSRIDMYFPLGSEICVELNQKVKGRQTVLGRLK